MGRRRLEFGRWFFRLFSCDGLLPVVIVLIPGAIVLAMPGWRGLVELTAIALPIAAFGVRVHVGRRQIGSNACPRWFRGLQFAAFGAGLLILLLLDAFSILSWIMPPVDPLSAEDFLIFGVFAAVYLVLMAVAMYPGLVLVEDPSDPGL
jgi:hypothetical protein